MKFPRKNDLKLFTSNSLLEMDQQQLEEDLLLLIFKYGFQNVEKVFETMKPTIREKIEERLKIILPSSEVLASVVVELAPVPVVERVIEPVVERVIESVIEPVPEHLPKGTNEKKKAQREAEKKKREENEAQGIFAQDLLTEENLRTWRNAKYSNAYIAREFVGCREEEVAKALKKFNIV